MVEIKMDLGAEEIISVLEKNGYLQEGILRHYPFGREFHDAVMLAIVRY